MPRFVEVPASPKKIDDQILIRKPFNIIDPFGGRSVFRGNIIRNRNWGSKIHSARLNSIKMPSPGEGLPRVMHYCADQGGCAFWRLIFVGDELLANNKAVVQTMYQMIPDPNIYVTLNAVRLQRQCNEPQKQFIKHLRHISDMFKKQGKPGFKIIWEIDDIVAPVDALPDFNACKSQFSDPQIEKNVREILHMCDEMTVPSEAMRQHYKSFTGFDKISVIPNYVPRYWFDRDVTEEIIIERYRKHKKKPRILYAGSSTHFDLAGLNGQQDDFSHVNKVILDDITGPKKYQWVFLGGTPRSIAPYVASGDVELHKWVSMTEYPRMLHNLDVNVMIAPLANHVFNHCKANIKLTEGAALGIPTIAQNISCYNHDGWKYLFDTGEQMMSQIENILKDEDSIRKTFVDIREYGNRYWLTDHLQDWIDVYTTPYGDPSRKNNKDFYERNKEQFAK